MRFSKRLLMGAVAVTSAAILLVSSVAILTPRVVRAVTAELVQDIDSPIRNPWTANCRMAPSSGSSNSCTIPLQPGQAVVIQTLTFQGSTSFDRHILMQLETGIGSERAIWNHEFSTSALPVLTDTSILQFVASENLTMYANNSTSGITVQLSTADTNPITFPFGGLGGNVTLVGYSVNAGNPSSGTN
jgi:hypothetical protein